MNLATETAPTQGIIGPVRFSYLTAFKPRMNNGRTPPVMEYGVLCLIPKEANEFCPDPAKVKTEIQAFIKNAAATKFGAGVKGLKTPLKDGDKADNEGDEPPHPGYWFMRASCKEEYPPLCFDGNGAVVSGGWESGDWGKVKVSFFAFDKEINKGVSAGLRAFQFLFKDEPLGNTSDPVVVANEFGVVPGAHSGGTQSEPAAEYDPFSD